MITAFICFSIASQVLTKITWLVVVACMCGIQCVVEILYLYSMHIHVSMHSQYTQMEVNSWHSAFYNR